MRRHLLWIFAVVYLSISFARADETAELNAIRSSVEAAQPLEKKDSPEDILTKRATALKTVDAAKKFLVEHPASESIIEAHMLLSTALMQASLYGDTNSVATLRERVSKLITDPKVDDFVKEQAIAMEYYTDWGLKNGGRFVDEVSDEGRSIYCDTLFAVVDRLPQKEIKEQKLERLLLEARSEYKLTTAQVHSIAQRVHDHPAATSLLKSEAEKILKNERPYEVGKPLDLKFTAMDGREVDLAKLRGKVVLIDFWATWCGPCVAAFPAVKKTYETYHDKGLEIISISLDDDKDALLSFLKKNGPAPWPHYFDGKGWNTLVSWRFGINSVPHVWLVDKEGILRATKVPTDSEGMYYLKPYLE